MQLVQSATFLCCQLQDVYAICHTGKPRLKNATSFWLRIPCRVCSSPNASCFWMGCKQTRCDDRMEQIDNRLSTVQTTAAVNMLSAPEDWWFSASWHHTAHRLVIVSCYRYLQWFLGNGLSLQKEIFCIFFVKKWMVHFKWSWIHDNRTRNSRRKRQLFY